MKLYKMYKKKVQMTNPSVMTRLIHQMMKAIVISSNEYDIGEASEICEPLIVLASEKSNYDIYSFASSEDLSDVDFCIPKKINVRKSSILYILQISKDWKIVAC